MKRFFRTVLGDISVDQMGLTYAHEHIIIEDSYPTSTNPVFLLNDVDKISEELIGFYDAGGRTVVDTMPANAGRNVQKLVEVSTNSKVHIIAPTGIHLEIYYPKSHWRYEYTETQLTDLFVDDIEKGIDKFDYSGPYVDRTPHKAGLIKLATGDETITKHQEKIFRAVVNAHLETGAPILTHTNYGKHALEQALLFDKLGADLNHVVLSHVDRYQELDYQKRVLDTGVRVEYDSAFRWKPDSKNWTLYFLKELLAIYPDQFTVGMDMAKNSYWKSYGGAPGLNFLIEEIPKYLDELGLGEYTEKLFFENPKELYAFSKTQD